MKNGFIWKTITSLLALSSLVTATPAATNPVQLALAKSAAIAPNGKTIATALRNIELWDSASGKRLGQLDYDGGDVYHLIFSPDGSLLVAGGVFKKTITVFDINTRQTVATIKSPDSLDLVPIGFLEDSKSIVAGSPKAIIVLSLPEGAVTKSIPIPGNIESFVLLEGAKEVVTIGKFDGKLTAWNLQTGKASSRQFKQDKDSTPSLSSILSVAGPGKIAVASFMGQTLFLFDCGTGALAHKFSGLSLRQAGFTKEGTRFAYGSWNHTGENFVTVVETGSGKTLAKFGPFEKKILFARALLSADGGLLVGVPNEGVAPVLVWQMK